MTGRASLPADHRERLLRLEELHGRALFARGFLLGRERPSYVPDGWTAEQIHGHRLLRDPRVPLHRLGDGRHELLLLGDAFDLRAPERTNQDVTSLLFDALVRSRQALHELTDWLLGRYAVIYRDGRGDGLRLLTDATGMRAAFHTADARWVGSHASLVAVNAGHPHAPRPHSRFGYPGMTTAYRDVLVLIPNHELRVGTGGVIRFFPRAPLEPMAPDAVADAAGGWLEAALTAIALRHPHPVVSLTAGLDSRITLAVSRRAAPGARFFTYYRRDDVDTDRADREIAGRLADRLRLHHRLLVLDDFREPSPRTFQALSGEHSYYRHIHRAAYAYTRLFDPDSDVHIRSNLSEIGRSFYRTVPQRRRPRPRLPVLRHQGGHER